MDDDAHSGCSASCADLWDLVRRGGIWWNGGGEGFGRMKSTRHWHWLDPGRWPLGAETHVDFTKEYGHRAKSAIAEARPSPEEASLKSVVLRGAAERRTSAQLQVLSIEL